jgi:hypothetical protein
LGFGGSTDRAKLTVSNSIDGLNQARVIIAPARCIDPVSIPATCKSTLLLSTLNFYFVAKEKAKRILGDVAQDVREPSSGVSTSSHNFLREFGLFVADWNDAITHRVAPHYCHFPAHARA